MRTLGWLVERLNERKYPVRERTGMRTRQYWGEDPESVDTIAEPRLLVSLSSPDDRTV